MLRVARGLFARLLGLWAVPFGPGHDGLLIRPCRAIHTLGLRRPIDVVFLDERGRVLRCHHNLAPNRVAGVWRARMVVELPGGSCLGLKDRSEEHTSELQSLMRISYAVFCLKKKKNKHQTTPQKQK